MTYTCFNKKFVKLTVKARSNIGALRKAVRVFGYNMEIRITQGGNRFDSGWVIPRSKYYYLGEPSTKLRNLRKFIKTNLTYDVLVD